MSRMCEHFCIEIRSKCKNGCREHSPYLLSGSCSQSRPLPLRKNARTAVVAKSRYTFMSTCTRRDPPCIAHSLVRRYMSVGSFLEKIALV
jgi:hypothetical protein